MTELRDARLRQAMEHAPDADLRPPPRVRVAIRAAAGGAVTPWWKRWSGTRGDRRVPWSAALATVVLGTLITVTWRGQDIPGVRPEAQGADRAAPVEVPGAAMEVPGTPGEVPAAPAFASAVPAAGQPAAPPPVVGTRAHPTGPEVSPRVTMEAPDSSHARAQPPPIAADAERGRRQMPREEIAVARPVEPRAAATAAAPVVPPAVELRDAGSPPPPAPASPAPAATAPQMSPSPPPAADAAARATPTPAAAARAPQSPIASRLSAQQGAADWRRWTQVRIEDGAGSVLVAREPASALQEMIEAVLRAAPGPAPAGASALRLQLMEGDQRIGTLEAVDGDWRWLAAPPPPQPPVARGLRADPVAAAALRAEAERLLRR